MKPPLFARQPPPAQCRNFPAQCPSLFIDIPAQMAYFSIQSFNHAGASNEKDQ